MFNLKTKIKIIYLRKYENQNKHKINGETNYFYLKTIHSLTNKTYHLTFRQNFRKIKILTKIKNKNKTFSYFTIEFQSYCIKKITYKFYFK